MNELTQLLADLVAINSINPDLVSGGAGERACAEFVADWCQRADLEVHIHEVQPNRPNVVAIARGSGGGKALMLNGHIDVVGVAGMTEPFTPRIEDGRMYGRGAFDMKCGVAASMIATRNALKGGLRGDVIFTAVMDEECGGLGTQDIARRYRADAAIVTEPTDMQLVIAHKGFVWLEIETHGVAAHGSRPDLGVDAICKMGRVLVELEQLGKRLRAHVSHPVLGSSSVHAGLIRGGQEASSYPASCVVSVEWRSLPSESPDFVEAQINDIVRRLSADDPDFRATVRRKLDLAPMNTPPDAPIAQLIRTQTQRVAGVLPPDVGMPYWTDASTLSQVGIPSVLFGPIGAGAHAVEEWVDLKSVEQCAEIYTHIAREWCA
jgi:acetylornithine deacetylase